MAGEIGVTLRVKTVNGSFQADFNPGSQAIDQNAIGSDGGVVSVSTGGTTRVMDKVTTFGFFTVTNTDASNYVEIGPSTAALSAPHPFERVKPGESHALRLVPGIITRAVANVAAVKLQFTVLED